jgi:RNA polymerase sigma factor (sigma-70 family)
MAEPSAEEEALKVLSSENMFDLIDQLSDEQRQVLILKFVFDFSNVEAAAVLEKTEGAIKSLQHRALASLQKHVANS